MADSQIWFFLYEDVKSRSTLPRGFKQGYTTLDKVKQKGITFHDCMEIAGIQGDINENSFWLHSNSMKAAVQLQSDESIKVTWGLYCRAPTQSLQFISASAPTHHPTPPAQPATAPHLQKDEKSQVLK
jgi:hypothetical protein